MVGKVPDTRTDRAVHHWHCLLWSFPLHAEQWFWLHWECSDCHLLKRGQLLLHRAVLGREFLPMRTHILPLSVSLSRSLSRARALSLPLSSFVAVCTLRFERGAMNPCGFRLTCTARSLLSWHSSSTSKSTRRKNDTARHKIHVLRFRCEVNT